jgi:hypothetical protein
MSIEKLQRSNIFQARSSIDEQTRGLESKCVVRSDVRIEHDVSITHQTAFRAVSSTATYRRGAYFGFTDFIASCDVSVWT